MSDINIIPDSTIPGVIEDLLAKNGATMNETIRNTIGEQNQLNTVEDMQDLLDSLQSDDFWDDILQVQDKALHDNPLPQETSKYVQAGLYAIAESSDAYEELYESQEKLIEFISNKTENTVAEILNSAQVNAPEDLNQCYKQITDFSDSTEFWNELVQMQTEVKDKSASHTKAPLTTQPTVVQEQQNSFSSVVEDSLDIFGSVGDAQDTLSEQSIEIIDIVKAEGIHSQNILSTATEVIPLAIGQSESQEVQASLQTMMEKSEEEFYPEIVSMQEETNANNLLATISRSSSSPVGTVFVEPALRVSTDAAEEVKKVPIVEEEGRKSVSTPLSSPSSAGGKTLYEGDLNDYPSLRGKIKPSATPPAAPAPTDAAAATTQLDTLIVTSTLWEDIDVATLNPANQIIMDKVGVSSNPILASMVEEIETRSLKGPNIRYSFMIIMIAAISIGLISYSNSVRESPILFRILWVLAFMINFITVSIPGRLDRVLVDGNHIKPWTSLFEAATWSFAIWGAIYASEVCLSGYVSIIGIPMKLFQKIVPYWLAGNWFQGLWCFAFRPEFKSALWVPTLFLALGTYTFTRASYEVTMFTKENYASPGLTPQKLGLMSLRIPLAMHAAWLAAATLLNFNSYIAVSGGKKSLQIAVAHASIYIAAAYGVYCALMMSDATISWTIAWALQAIAQRTFEKVKQPGNVVGADVQESLAMTENMVANGLKCISLGIMVAPFVAQ